LDPGFSDPGHPYDGLWGTKEDFSIRSPYWHGLLTATVTVAYAFQT